MNNYDVVIIGGGPAGLAASLEVYKNNKSCLIIEREASLGGILKQCIHDGFGVIRFNDKLSGPEYTERFIDQVINKHIPYLTLSFVTKIEKEKDLYILHVVTREGIKIITANKIIFATGCRERTSKQIFIHGTRPAGIFTAGTAQALVNLNGLMPTKKAVILGSGDIGLIMARRLTLEGAKVVGVYEVKNEPSGLARNIHQCLYDYNIPLYLSTTVTRVIGDDRLTAVEIAKVDNKMNVIENSKQIVECDSLILSVGLIPENELALTLGVKLNKFSKGPECDQSLETNINNVYTCGNATHVNNLVDYVSESAEIAAKNSCIEKRERKLISINVNENVLYVVPTLIDVNNSKKDVVMYFRSNKSIGKATVKINVDGKSIFVKTYLNIKPPEMEKIVVDFKDVNENAKIDFEIIKEN